MEEFICADCGEVLTQEQANACDRCLTALCDSCAEGGDGCCSTCWTPDQ